MSKKQTENTESIAVSVATMRRLKNHARSINTTPSILIGMLSRIIERRMETALGSDQFFLYKGGKLLDQSTEWDMEDKLFGERLS